MSTTKTETLLSNGSSRAPKSLSLKTDHGYSRPTTPSAKSKMTSGTTAPPPSPPSNGTNGQSPPPRDPEKKVTSPAQRPKAGPQGIDILRLHSERAAELINGDVTESARKSRGNLETLLLKLKDMSKEIKNLNGQVSDLKEANAGLTARVNDLELRNMELDEDLQEWISKKDVLDLVSEQLIGSSDALELLLKENNLDLDDF